MFPEWVQFRLKIRIILVYFLYNYLYTIRTYPEFLLPLGSHETLLRLLGLGGLLHALAHLSALAVDLGLFGLLRLDKSMTW